MESLGEKVKTPMMSSKFLHLKYLDIYLVNVVQHYLSDYSCLVSFLEASPALETFILRIQTDDMLVHDSVFGDLDGGGGGGGAQLHLRQLLECWHHNLKNVMVTGFTSTKGLIEFTRYIVQNSLVLECMTLDTAGGCCRRTAKRNKCAPMSEGGFREAQKAVEAVRICIEGIVRPSTNLKVLEPCSQCLYEGSSV
ncbi:hypothetical protein PVAP13_8NG104201 [Panicum virgatum]|uniref:At1g61320/AtMIF1 LRR domain-containing protein n=1 Tax=Panicum virgatum TaxID=38727 RepID=A0A8T0PBB8_PANVG|nr:hypothetical protein PVAP13_8NG104201 [Panicum virgatum]